MSMLNVWATRRAGRHLVVLHPPAAAAAHPAEGGGRPPLDPCAAMTRLLHLRFATAYPTLLFPRPPSWPHTITCCGALVARSPAPSFLPPPQLHAILEKAEQDDDQKPVFLRSASHGRHAFPHNIHEVRCGEVVVTSPPTHWPVLQTNRQAGSSEGPRFRG